MKNVLLFLSFIFIFSNCFSQLVSIDRAKLVAENLIAERNRSLDKAALTVAFHGETTIYHNEVPVFHIMKTNGIGFVIVSADERITPVLGYSFNNSFDENDVPDCLQWLLEKYSEQIYSIVKDDIECVDANINALWEKYETGDITKSDEELQDVGPLTTTTWSQGCYYNTMCPADASLGTTRCGRCPTGCVATAFAQILKYYNYPAQGASSKSYNHATYGALSANFAGTTYNWASMPNKLLSENQAAAQLLYHCGIAIAMDYGPSGSSAYTTEVRKALVTYFKYASTAKYINKTSYTDLQWESTIKAELDAQRIVMINGHDPNAHAGHGFICDGYQGTNHFHINWGWNGSSDGYFYLNALSPSSYSFNSSVGAIIGIKPSTTPACCSGTTTLTAQSGTLSDGSGSSDYGNNLDCQWILKPINSATVSVNFTAFATEANYDFVKIYDGETTSSPLLGSYSGSSLPASITSTGNKVLIRFTSDGSATAAGWSLNYTGNPITTYCNGTQTFTAASGTITDGSGSKDYSNNSDCKWLISPANAQTVKVTFSSFKVESVNDKLYIYNGTTTNSPLLASYSGLSIPASVSASSGNMLLHFVTNGSITKAGWSAKYTSQTAYCSGIKTMTANAGTITDGSGTKYYSHNSSCKWLIKPANGNPVTLTFSAYNTEANADYVTIYNGETTNAPLLASYSGATIPASVTASSGKMLVHFTSNASVTKPGWTANYTTSSLKETMSEELNETNNIYFEVFPNPSNGNITVLLSEKMQTGNIIISDLIGKIVFEKSFINTNEFKLEPSLADGVYFLTIDASGNRISKKIIIQSNK